MTVLRAGLKRAELQSKKAEYSRTHTSMHIAHNTPIHRHNHMHPHTVSTPHIPTCLQSALHGFTQRFHLRVALYCSDDVTDGLKGLFSALLHQSPVQELVTLPRFIKLCQVVLITLTDKASVKKFPNDSISIHFLNELVPKEIEYLYSFMEREVTWYTNLITCKGS